MILSSPASLWASPQQIARLSRRCGDPELHAVRPFHSAHPSTLLSPKRKYEQIMRSSGSAGSSRRRASTVSAASEPARPPGRLKSMNTADIVLSRCVSIDLEVSPRDGHIHALAGVRADTGRSVTWTLEASGDDRTDGRVTCLDGDDVASVGDGCSVDEALAALDGLAEGADFVVGHNIIKFDLPRLQAVAPGLGLLRMPVVDTLWLNPLAFPANPYHHLVKHYKDAPLKRAQRNDPYLDARLALQVFDDQQHKLAETPPELVTAWHWLSTSPRRGRLRLVLHRVAWLAAAWRSPKHGRRSAPA